MTPHTCTTDDGPVITCLCVRGQDHTEDQFDVPLSADVEPGTDNA